MPAEEITNLYQFALIFPRTGTDPYGQPVVGSPFQVNCRWVSKRREVLDRQGNSVALDFAVDLAQDVAIGSRMWLGRLTDWFGTGSGVGNPDEELCEVKTFDHTPDEKGRAVKYMAGLMRLHNKGAN